MSFIEKVKQRAKKEIKTIVLPEAEDIRILEATEQVLKEQYANIVLVGNQEKIEKKAKENNIDINKCYEKVVFLKKYLKEYIKEIRKILIFLWLLNSF